MAKTVKFISSELYQKLSVLGDVIDNKPLVGILNDFLLEFKKDEVVITASNLQTTLQTTVTLVNTEEFNIAIPAGILLDTMKNLSSQEVQMTVDTQKNIVLLKTFSGVYRISYEDGASFPKITLAIDKKQSIVSSKTLYKAIKTTLVAASNDNTKPVINSVFLRFENDTITSVATDIHRLVKNEYNCHVTQQIPDILLPKKNLVSLLALLAQKEQDITISVDNKFCCVDTGEFVWTTTLLEEKYPDYERVIPHNNNNILTVDRDMLLAGLKRLMAFTSSMSYQVVFELTGQKLKITASDPNFGNEAEETMEILYSGQDNLKASFNIKYFIELLQNIDSEEVIIAFGDVNDNFVTNKAVVIKPENDAAKANITMLLMPMII